MKSRRKQNRVGLYRICAHMHNNVPMAQRFYTLQQLQSRDREIYSCLKAIATLRGNFDASSDRLIKEKVNTSSYKIFRITYPYDREPMERLEIANQIILLEAVRRFFPQSENKELVVPMIHQWYNEHATQFLPASEFRDMLTECFLLEVPQKTANYKFARPFSFRFS